MNCFFESSRRCCAAIAVITLISAIGCGRGLSVDTWLDDGAVCCRADYDTPRPDNCGAASEPPSLAVLDACDADVSSTEDDVFLMAAVPELESPDASEFVAASDTP